MRQTFSIAVRVTPGCSSNSIIRGTDGRINFRLASRPVEGKANKELIKIISRKLKIRQSDIVIVSGERSRDKTLLVLGLSREKVEEDLLT